MDDDVMDTPAVVFLGISVGTNFHACEGGQVPREELDLRSVGRHAAGHLDGEPVRRDEIAADVEKLRGRRVAIGEQQGRPVLEASTLHLYATPEGDQFVNAPQNQLDHSEALVERVRALGEHDAVERLTASLDGHALAAEPAEQVRGVRGQRGSFTRLGHDLDAGKGRQAQDGSDFE